MEPTTPKPAVTYVICTNPRSGSWLLSEGLTATSVAGNPREWFNSLEEQALSERCGLNLSVRGAYSAYLDQVVANATTRNGVCGIKLHYYQFADLPRKISTIDAFRGLPASRLMSTAFGDPRYIWLTRRDKARQAISYFRACRSGEWWLIDGVGRPPRATGDIEFDADAIERLEMTLRANDTHWRRYFTRNDVQPLIIDYEDLAADYAGHISHVLRWLNIPEANAVPIPPPRLRRQRDDRTEEWLARYLEHKHGARGRGARRRADARHSIPVGSPLFERSQQEALQARPAERPAVPPVADKPARLLDAYRRLRALDPARTTVERRPRLDRAEFLERYYAANRPVVLQGLMDDWPARRLWDGEYLKRAAGDASIEIMAGREADAHYEWNIQQHRTVVRFADYVDMVYRGGTTNDYYLVANNNFFARPGCRVLLDDVIAWDEYLDPALTVGRSFFWFGPAGAVTPLHHDACNILLAQVFGRKHLKLVPPDEWSLLYNTRTYFSEVDCEAPDFDRWPLFRDATVIDLTLEAGEVLFMPVGWWHHVRTLEASAMVSFTNFVFPNSYDW